MMTIRRDLLSLLFSLCCIFTVAAAQEQPDTTVQRVPEAMPRLEIPEITIVGKKAITLPFARKGEIYDIPIYEAPPADTGLLLERPSPQLPTGSLPRYEHREMPWRFSLEGALGSFGTGSGKGFLDYNAERWGMGVRGGFGTTNGHVDRADGTSLELGGDVHALVETDNNLLRNFRASLEGAFIHDEFGLYGFSNDSTDRTRDHFNITGGINAVNRQGALLDVNLGVDIADLSDEFSLVPDSSVSAVSPNVASTLALSAGQFRFIGDFLYKGSSLDYEHPIESPNLLRFDGSIRWHVLSGWMLTVGATFANGTDSRGESTTLVAPSALARINLASGTSLAFWFQPEMQLTTYTEHFRNNPYFDRELELRPERKPINVGGSLWFNTGILALDIRAGYSESKNFGVTYSDSGRMFLVYGDAVRSLLEVNGSLKSSNNTQLKFSAILQPTYAKGGSTTQLPHIPTVKFSARGELDLRMPVSLWSGAEYWSKRNIDFAATRTLGDVFLLHAGASTRLIPQTLISLDLSNILNTSYDWWNGFRAPGRRIMVEAKVSLR